MRVEVKGKQYIRYIHVQNCQRKKTTKSSRSSLLCIKFELHVPKMKETKLKVALGCIPMNPVLS